MKIARSAYKVSKYNMIVPLPNTDVSVLHNLMSGSVIRIENNHDYKIAEKLTRGEMPSCSDESDLNLFISNGFIIMNSIDEASIINLHREWSKYNYATVTIIPTLECNFQCFYCYGRDIVPSSAMNSHVIDSVIEYISNMRANNIFLVFYGGEPTLEIKTVNKILQSASKLNSSTKTISTLMVTNGYLLDMRTARKLAASGLHHVQITLDGDKNTHNLRRRTLDDNPTYDIILGNIKDIAKRNLFRDGITIRMNVESEWMEQAVEQMKEFNKLSNVYPYLAPTEHDHLCNTSSNDHTVRKVIDSGLFSVGEASGHMRANYCSPVALESILVTPNGEIYKCIKELYNNTSPYGNLLLDNYSNTFPFIYWTMGNINSNESMCIECKYLPICTGTCFIKNQKGNKCEALNKDRVHNQVIQYCISATKV